MTMWIIDHGAAFETTNLASSYAVLRQDIIDKPPVLAGINQRDVDRLKPSDFRVRFHQCLRLLSQHMLFFPGGQETQLL